MSDYITAEETIRLVRMMPVQERARLKDILYSDNENRSCLKERLTEQRFAEDRVCQHCGGHHVRGNGHRKDDTMLGAIVEADEAFFPTSYKGNSRHFDGGTKREPRRRGGEIHTRGLSDELVCVPCFLHGD